jgi:hypothetical protein
MQSAHVLPSPLAKDSATSHQTPNRKEEHLQVFITTNTPLRYCKPPIQDTIPFSTSINIMEIYIETCPMEPTRKGSFTPCPDESTLAEDKGAQGQSNFDLAI